MGIDALVRELRERSRQEEAAIRREAEEKAERIVDQARREAGEKRERALRTAEQELRDELRAERDREESEVREEVMEARHELLERVRSRARGLLGEAAASGTYRSGLPGQLREALACLPADREVVIRCPPALEEPIRDALSGTEERVRVEPDDGESPGFRASTPDGAVTADATLGRRLERDWSELVPAVLDDLEERWAATGDR